MASKLLLLLGLGLLLVACVPALAQTTAGYKPTPKPDFSFHVCFPKATTDLSGNPGLFAGTIYLVDKYGKVDKTKVLGRKDGLCHVTQIFSSVPPPNNKWSVCQFSYSVLKNGAETSAISVSGTFDDRRSVNVFTINGGYGNLFGATRTGFVQINTIASKDFVCPDSVSEYKDDFYLRK